MMNSSNSSNSNSPKSRPIFKFIIITLPLLAATICHCIGMSVAISQGLFDPQNCPVDVSSVAFNYSLALQTTVSACESDVTRARAHACILKFRSNDTSCTDFSFCGPQCVYAFSNWFWFSFILMLVGGGLSQWILLLSALYDHKIDDFPCILGIFYILINVLWIVTSSFAIMGRSAEQYVLIEAVYIGGVFAIWLFSGGTATRR